VIGVAARYYRDDAVMDTKEAWAAKLRARLIGDFQNWKNHDAYKKTFERVVRDLTIPAAGSVGGPAGMSDSLKLN
jgi:hypothetical protein